MSALAILHESSRQSRLIVKTSSVRNFGANMLGDEQQRCVEGSCGLGVLQADGLTCRRKPICVASRIIWHTSELIIWRTSCESGVKRLGEGIFRSNMKL